MKPFLLLPVLLLLVPAIGQENAVAQSKTDLVGTWKLVSATDTTDKGQVIHNVYGLNPTGFLTYTADGRMMAIITDADESLYPCLTACRRQQAKEQKRFRPRLPMVDDTRSTATK
jgi:lipocalin-like protein